MCTEDNLVAAFVLLGEAIRGPAPELLLGDRHRDRTQTRPISPQPGRTDSEAERRGRRGGDSEFSREGRSRSWPPWRSMTASTVAGCPWLHTATSTWPGSR